MFTRVEFRNFKALEHFSLSLRSLNVLTGSNNAGKSTVLDGFRALSGAYKLAKRRLPDTTKVFGGRQHQAYTVPTTLLPITVTNIQTNYAAVDASVTFTLENGRRLIVHFNEEQHCRLLLDPDGPYIRSVAQFKKHYPIELAIVPTLGPIEEEERLLADETVEANQASRRSHRMFRNIWHRKGREEFNELKRLVSETWPGMQIHPTERSGYGPNAQIQMFCEEEHMLREIFWAGFGFQVWLQFLTHIIGAARATTIIVDEPDIYLHPDLQHKLFHLLRATERQILLATHSIEIINEAEYDDVVLINKKHRSGKRVTDVKDLQAAIEALGSTHNVHLNRLSRDRRVLFLEGGIFASLSDLRRSWAAMVSRRH